MRRARPERQWREGMCPWPALGDYVPPCRYMPADRREGRPKSEGAPATERGQGRFSARRAYNPVMRSIKLTYTFFLLILNIMQCDLFFFVSIISIPLLLVIF